MTHIIYSDADIARAIEIKKEWVKRRDIYMSQRKEERIKAYERIEEKIKNGDVLASQTLMYGIDNIV